MAFKDFSEKMYFKVFDTSETINIGSFDTTQNGELGHLRALVYVKGTLVGSEQIRFTVYPAESSTSAMYTSDWMDISGIVDENGNSVTGNWVGLLKIDFNREHIDSDIEYFLKAELNNYTRDNNTYYIALGFDFPLYVYDNSENYFYDHPLKHEIFLYRERV
jgi:hypothetical protein